MKIRTIIFLISLFFHSLLNAQTSHFAIDSSLKAKRYNELCFPTTHNSFNYLIGPKQYIYPNQRFDIPKQLEDGIRGFMIDIHDHDKIVPLKSNNVYVFHEQAILGKEKLADVLTYFSNFLQANPQEIITIILDCKVSDSKKVAAVFESHPIYKFMYHHADSLGWPIIDTMIQRNQRCVVFTHCEGYSDWYLHQNNYCFENDYHNENRDDYQGKIIRGDSSKSIFIMNHFIYNIFERKLLNARANKQNNLLDHINICRERTGKLPNFLTVDWYDQGDLFKVVYELNHESK